MAFITWSHLWTTLLASEAMAFEQHPDFKALIEMRQWDDKAKNKAIAITENYYYQDLCRKVLSGSQ